MKGFWFFVPKSGVAFIFISVLFIVLWNGVRNELPYPYAWIFTIEIFLFVVCFIVADRERPKKINLRH